jgi:hypothetical protein
LNNNEEIRICQLIEERRNNLYIFLKSAWFAVTNTEDIELPVLESFIRLISNPDIIYQMDSDLLNVKLILYVFIIELYIIYLLF